MYQPRLPPPSLPLLLPLVLVVLAMASTSLKMASNSLSVHPATKEETESVRRRRLWTPQGDLGNLKGSLRHLIRHRKRKEQKVADIEILLAATHYPIYSTNTKVFQEGKSLAIDAAKGSKH